MPRRKQPREILTAAHDYLHQHAPELEEIPLVVRALDGPADAPRFSATAETCSIHVCPYGVDAEVAARGECSVPDCAQRCSVRLLLDDTGTVIQVLRGGTHWT